MCIYIFIYIYAIKKSSFRPHEKESSSSFEKYLGHILGWYRSTDKSAVFPCIYDNLCKFA